jgi:hypothetical protein
MCASVSICFGVKVADNFVPTVEAPIKFETSGSVTRSHVPKGFSCGCPFMATRSQRSAWK